MNSRVLLSQTLKRRAEHIVTVDDRREASAPSPSESGLPAGLRITVGLGILLGVSAWLRLQAWQHTHVIFNDGPIFLALAEAIADGRWEAVLGHPFHPLYPALVAAVYSVFGVGFETAAIWVSVLGGVLSVLGLFCAAKSAFGDEIAWMTGWVVALHPWAIDFSSDVMSDGLYAGLFLMGFAALSEWNERPRLLLAIGCGIGAGLAYLVRPEGLGLCAVAIVVFAARGWRDASARRGVFVSALALVLATLALVGPLAAAVSEQTGHLTLTRKKSIVELAAGRSGVRVELPTGEREAALPLPLSSVRVSGSGFDRPPRTLLGVGEAISRAMRTSLAAFRYEIALFAAIGLIVMRGTAFRKRLVLFALPAVLYSALLVLLVWGAGYVARRHALAAWLPLTVFAAIGWRGLHHLLVNRWTEPDSSPRARWTSPPAVCFGLVLVLALVWGNRDFRDRRIDRVPVRAAANWLAEREGPGLVVGAQKMRVAYYAQARYVPLPSGKSSSIEAALRHAGVEWLVIDERRVDDHRGLKAGVGDWLHLVHVESGEGGRVLVLELR